ncbi:MAG: DUF421 domain-containing protein [Acuticoccus sp.]
MRVIVCAVAGYAALVVLLRISGKRTLSDMNAFDFVVTVALGSILATTILNSTVALAEGIAALVTLVALQALVALLAARSRAVRKAVKSEPTLLVRHGTLLVDAVRAARLSEAEILAAIRASGEADLAGVAAVVLETNGDLSVIPQRADRAGAALEPA